MRGTLVVAVAAIALCRCTDASEPPSVDFIQAALAFQGAASIEVTYTLHQGDVARDRVHYVRTPEVLFREDHDLELDVIVRNSYDRCTNEFRALEIWPDGKTVGWLTTETHNLFNQQDLLETVRFPMPRATATAQDTLLGWITQGWVARNKEAVDGHMCWRIVIPKPRPLIRKYRVFLDPEVGFCPRRIEFLDDDGTTSVFSFGEYAEPSDGIWFPRRMAIESSEGGPGGEIETVTQLITLDDIRIGVDTPKEDLLVRFPAGAIVRIGDSRDNLVIREPR